MVIIAALNQQCEPPLKMLVDRYLLCCEQQHVPTGDHLSSAPSAGWVPAGTVADLGAGEQGN